MSQEQVSNWKWIFPQRQRSSPSKRKYASQRWKIISGFYITVKGDDDNWFFWHHPERWLWAKVLTSPSKVVMIAVATGVASLVIGFILGFFLRFVLAIIIVGIIIIIIIKIITVTIASSPSQLHHHHHNRMLIGTPQPSVLHGKEFKSKCNFKHCSLDEALSYWEVS